MTNPHVSPARNVIISKEYDAGCAACWLGYGHDLDKHTAAVAEHRAQADRFSTREGRTAADRVNFPHSRGCGCGYKPAGDR